MPMKTRLLCLALITSPALIPADEAPGQMVTFNRQIAPIIYNNCSSCHRPGEAAPFSLLSYQDISKRARTIASVTAARFMPPWKAESGSYPFQDERRLQDTDIALIQAWVKQGMPEGNEPAPAPPKFASGWILGEPNLIVEMPAAFHVPADGPDIYRNMALQLGLTEDKWITAIDMKPTARSVVHHVLYFADPSGKAHNHPRQGSEPGFTGMRPGGEAEQIGGWAVGAQPHREPAGLAIPISKGSDLVIQYHFHPNGKAAEEKSVLGLYFAKEAPKRSLVAVQLPPTYSLFSGLDIPAGEKDFVIRDSYTLPAAMDAVSIGAHAHYIGKQFKMTATLPSGEVKTLLWIRDWDFSWQDRYFFKDFVSLPKGTRLDAEVHWDNTSDNPRNPSVPPIRVQWGEQSKDEMGSLTLVGVPHDEADVALLRQDILKHRNQVLRAGMAADPGLRQKIAALLAE
jgi:mono/diheme cytochrome c family protein